MNVKKRASPDATRHRILEGLLLRLARQPGHEQLILRGGMLMRLWFRPLDRTASDLDLVATYPFDIEATRQRFLPVLTDRGVDDGVEFDPRRFLAEGIWQHTDFPGVRLFLAARADDVWTDVSVDVTFGEPLRPAPRAGDYLMGSAADRGLTARLWMCRPETIIGRKLHALWHMGMQWRPKDLNDLRLLLTRVPLNLADVPEAIVSSFTSRGDPPADARAVFGPDGWWGMKTSTARWHDFVRETEGLDVPRKLGDAVADVVRTLGPVLEQIS